MTGFEIDIEPSKPAKPGWRTTEFWMTAIVSLFAAAQAVELFGYNTPAMKLISMAVIALNSMGYTVSRGITKSSNELTVK